METVERRNCCYGLVESSLGLSLEREGNNDGTERGKVCLLWCESEETQKSDRKCVTNVEGTLYDALKCSSKNEPVISLYLRLLSVMEPTISLYGYQSEVLGMSVISGLSF